ncbi:MAG: hypothetical protein FWC15_00470 [Fibromonadales bacterium]|nr:hypothetical protein [Fibromonadales bacterium]
MDKIANTAISSDGFLTVLAHKLTSGEAFVVIVMLLIAAIIAGIIYLRNKDKEQAKIIDENTKLRTDARDKEQMIQNADIKETKEEVSKIKQRLAEFATQKDLKEIENDYKALSVTISDMREQNFTKADGKEVFQKVDKMNDKLDDFKNLFLEVILQNKNKLNGGK